MKAMPTALDRPTLFGLVDAWSVQPVAIVAAVIVLGWYLRAARRAVNWPRRRTVSFAIGVALLVWTTNGFPQAYARALFWVWTSQLLILLLAVPAVLMAGQPISLARRVGGAQAVLVRLSRSRAGRFFANPLVGPALIPVLSAALFFGPLPRWAIANEAFGWPLHLVVVAVGSFIVLPLLSDDDTSTSLAVGLSLAIGVFELVLDAVPGIVLRLNTHLVTSYFDSRRSTSWAATPIHDQQIAGAIFRQ